MKLTMFWFKVELLVSWSKNTIEDGSTVFVVVIPLNSRTSGVGSNSSLSKCRFHLILKSIST